jgi:hypothetical protein
MTHPRVPHDPPVRPFGELDTIFMRQSVRAYTPQPLDESTIRALLGCCRPSGDRHAPRALGIRRGSRPNDAQSHLGPRQGSWINEAAHDCDLYPGIGAPMATTFAQRVASPDFCVFTLRVR